MRGNAFPQEKGTPLSEERHDFSTLDLSGEILDAVKKMGFESLTPVQKETIPIMMEGGGYVFASDHSIPSSVSFENMKLITDLAKKLGKY